MIPVVVFVLALVASGLSLPLTTQGHVPTENVQQFFTEVPVTQFVEKTGVQGSPETYSPVQTNTPVTKVENVPAKVDQTHYPENPVLLPVQPLSVVPAGQAGQVFRPVIVPAEAITAGRVIIAGIEPIQQRNFPQEEIANVENPAFYQQGVHPATYTPVQVQGAQSHQQPYYAQSNEKQTPVVPTGQQYSPVNTQVQYNTEPLIREQVVPVHPVQENFEQVQNYNPVPVEHNPQVPQVYSLPQNVQPIVVQSPEKNVPYQVESGYVPVQTVQQPVHEVGEKQLPYQQGSGYTPVQVQGVESGSQYQTPVVNENIEKQVPQQQYNEYQTQGYNVQQGEKQVPQQQYQQEYQQGYNVQQGEKQGEYQQQTYTPVQNQQVYNVQSDVEKQGHYQTNTAEFQQQQVQTTQQGVETQVPVQRVEPLEPVHEQQVYSAKPVDQIQPIHTHPVESVNQQQVYNAQQFDVNHAQSQVPYQQVQPQNNDYIQDVKTSEVVHQQSYVEPQQVVNYATETGYNFGDKIPQNTPLAAVPQPQATSVHPSVVSPQE